MWFLSIFNTLYTTSTLHFSPCVTLYSFLHRQKSSVSSRFLMFYNTETQVQVNHKKMQNLRINDWTFVATYGQIRQP